MTMSDTLSTADDTPPVPAGVTPLMAAQRMVRPAVAALCVVLAYHYSLRTLLDSLTLDTPLAHLALVPLISIGLALVALRRPAGPDIHDRQLDWIVAIPLLVTALAANVLLPTRLSTMFWVWRVDLLTLPLFTAGVITLLFGVRMLWRLRLAVLFLFLAWPYPYAIAIERWLNPFTSVTVGGLKFLVNHVHVAKAAVGQDAVFVSTHAGKQISMNVASQCSGANGLVGFGLVAGAFLLVARGPRAGKLLWLLVGAVLVWVTNLFRILIVFAAATWWGESVAIDGFHPVIGLVTFNIVVLLMIAIARYFRISFGGRSRPVETRAATATRPPYRPKLAAGLVCALAVTFVIGTLNGDLRNADAVATSLGSPRLASFAVSQEHPGGWALNEVGTIDWAKRFFGRSSVWTRYTFTDLSPKYGLLSSNMAVTGDIIETSSRSALAAYGVEQCYAFHGYKVSKQQSVDLGGGVVGGLLTWRDTSEHTWTTLYWHWPIKTSKGTRYERVTLIVNDQDYSQYGYPSLDSALTKQVELRVTDTLRGGHGDQLSDRLLRARSFLVSFGRDLVRLRQPAQN
jgi:exosortase/archaeosortase family protein